MCQGKSPRNREGWDWLNFPESFPSCRDLPNEPWMFQRFSPALSGKSRPVETHEMKKIKTSFFERAFDLPQKSTKKEGEAPKLRISNSCQLFVQSHKSHLCNLERFRAPSKASGSERSRAIILRNRPKNKLQSIGNWRYGT